MRIRGGGATHYPSISISTFLWSIVTIIERYRVHSLRQGKNGLRRIMNLTKFFYLKVNSTTQRYPNKIFKTFPICTGVNDTGGHLAAVNISGNLNKNLKLPS
jgi:hypothetical protein